MEGKQIAVAMSDMYGVPSAQVGHFVCCRGTICCADAQQPWLCAVPFSSKILHGLSRQPVLQLLQ